MSTDSDFPISSSIPTDDGACNHLLGMELPSLFLTSTTGRKVDLSNFSRGRVVVYIYPRIGLPEEDSIPGWDEIPGARGCTPQSCSFRDYNTELEWLGVSVFGLSTQDINSQVEAVKRLKLPFELLSDERLEFVRSLRLPTFEISTMTFVKRVTLILYKGIIEKVFYPVFPPDRNAYEVAQWLRENPLCV